MARRVVDATSVWPLRTFDTVEIATLASSAISARVGLPLTIVTREHPLNEREPVEVEHGGAVVGPWDGGDRRGAGGQVAHVDRVLFIAAQRAGAEQAGGGDHRSGRRA